MKEMNYYGWDIGGAHLKVAAVNCSQKLIYAKQYATPLWQGLNSLEQAFSDVMNNVVSGNSYHLVSMTGELVDIFSSRKQGVEKLNQICNNHLGNQYSLYSHNKGLLKGYAEIIVPDEVASANWHATAFYISQLIESGFFIDIGSTTTDIIPFSNKQILNKGYDDQSRLRHDELVYTGVIRTPLMALSQYVQFAGHVQGVCAEHFATTADVYRVLGLLDEDADMMLPADGGEKTIEASIMRLARMVGIDVDSIRDNSCLVELAEHYSRLQLMQLSEALKQVMSNVTGVDMVIVGAGAGEFLLKQLAKQLQFKFISFNELFDYEKQYAKETNLCAPAVALAQISCLHHSSS